MLHSKTLYCAPLQGYTDAAWRNAHHRIFGGVDCYLGPFMRIDRGQVRRRDVADAVPEANSAPFVPQIIACAPAEAVRLATLLRDQGHTRIDVNLGCPFPPVALRHKGAGMLKYPAEVEALAAALGGVDGVQYSVKMRLGWDDAGQWRQVLPAIASLSPVEVAVHPRTGRQQYKGELLADEFSLLYDACQLPLVLNGGIKSVADAEAALSRWPRLSGLPEHQPPGQQIGSCCNHGIYNNMKPVQITLIILYHYGSSPYSKCSIQYLPAKHKDFYESRR